MSSAARRIIGCVAVVSILAGCGARRPAMQQTHPIGRDPVGRMWLMLPDSVVRAVDVDRDSLVSTFQRPNRANSMIVPRFFDKTADPRGGNQSPLDKLQPTLRDWYENRSLPPDSMLTVIVALRDTFTLPLFPRGDPNLSHQDTLNVRIRATADSLVAAIRAARDDQYDADSVHLDNRVKPVFRSRFWLIHGFVLDVRFSRLLNLASSPRVVSVRPRFAGESAPACTSADPMCSDGSTTNDVASGARLMQADLLRGAGYGDVWLGVMDTGIREDHQMLTTGLSRSTAAGGKLYSCDESCPEGCDTDPAKCTTCPDGNADDLCGDGHGTGTAGILIGDGSKDAQFEGLTTATLDWYSVYKQDDCHGPCKSGKGAEVLDACAVIRAFESAVTRSAPVIVAEMQAIGTDLDPINLAAARAYTEGCAVIAATGNTDEIGTDVACPAREGSVIGVGARYHDGWSTTTAGPAQTVGPVNGRYKPDILGPTNTEVTSRCDDNGAMFFSYTSGATAYVGGAAALLSDLIGTRSSATDPGHLYAQLILAGNLTGNLTSSRFTDDSGAGLLTIPIASSVRWMGKEEFAVGASSTPHPTELEITRPLFGNFGSATTIDVAVWWPEVVTTSGVPTHRRIKLELLDPSGAIKASSDEATSVFQRVSYTGATPCFMVIDWSDPEIWKSGGPIGSKMSSISTTCWKVRLTTTDPDLCAGSAVQTMYWAAVAR